MDKHFWHSDHGFLIFDESGISIFSAISIYGNTRRSSDGIGRGNQSDLERKRVS